MRTILKNLPDSYVKNPNPYKKIRKNFTGTIIRKTLLVIAFLVIHSMIFSACPTTTNYYTIDWCTGTFTYNCDVYSWSYKCNLCGVVFLTFNSATIATFDATKMIHCCPQLAARSGTGCVCSGRMIDCGTGAGTSNISSASSGNSYISTNAMNYLKDLERDIIFRSKYFTGAYKDGQYYAVVGGNKGKISYSNYVFNKTLSDLKNNGEKRLLRGNNLGPDASFYKSTVPRAVADFDPANRAGAGTVLKSPVLAELIKGGSKEIGLPDMEKIFRDVPKMEKGIFCNDAAVLMGEGEVVRLLRGPDDNGYPIENREEIRPISVIGTGRQVTADEEELQRLEKDTPMTPDPVDSAMAASGINTGDRPEDLDEAFNKQITFLNDDAAAGQKGETYADLIAMQKLAALENGVGYVPGDPYLIWEAVKSVGKAGREMINDPEVAQLKGKARNMLVTVYNEKTSELGKGLDKAKDFASEFNVTGKISSAFKKINAHLLPAAPITSDGSSSRAYTSGETVYSKIFGSDRSDALKTTQPDSPQAADKDDATLYEQLRGFVTNAAATLSGTGVNN